MNKMLLSVFFMVACLSLLTTGQPTRNMNNCLKKEKSMINLDVAEDLTAKMKDLIPNCTDAVRNNSDCGVKDKALAYLDIINNLISQVKKNYPTCIGPNTKDPDPKIPVTNEPEIKEPVTEQPATREPKVYPRGRDCSEVLQNGQSESGVYTIWPVATVYTRAEMEVYCDMDTQGSGWTVIQRRGNFLPQEDFYRTWQDYKIGFGDRTKNYWLGNHNLFILSNQANYTIRFDLERDDGEKAYAEYSTFRIENELSNYKLLIDKYSGSAGNSMHRHNGHGFATRDRGESQNCANVRKSGWWSCGDANLNGEYKPGLISETSNYWNVWKSTKAGLAASEIKIKTMQRWK